MVRISRAVKVSASQRAYFFFSVSNANSRVLRYANQFPVTARGGFFMTNRVGNVGYNGGLAWEELYFIPRNVHVARAVGLFASARHAITIAFVYSVYVCLVVMRVWGFYRGGSFFLSCKFVGYRVLFQIFHFCAFRSTVESVEGFSGLAPSHPNMFSFVMSPVL